SRGAPGARVGWGRASFTTRFRSRKRRPLSCSMARSASSLVAISMKPKPRGRPVNWSVMMRTDWTVPACWKSSRRSSSVAWYDRFPTNSFADMAPLPSPTQDTPALRRADPLDEGSDRGNRRVLEDGSTLRGSGRQCQGDRGRSETRDRRRAPTKKQPNSEVHATTGPAVHRDAGARDEPGALGRQEGNHGRNVLRP